MNDDKLAWTINTKKSLLTTPVFEVIEQNETSATNFTSNYIAVKAPDWAIVVAEHDDNFILVKQYRHAEEKINVEFPGGVIEPGEDPEKGALRELEEETGYKAGKITKLGTCSPNPALFKNRIHIFLAEDLISTGKQNLDDDEFLNYMEVPVKEVIKNFCSEKYSHAFMGTALALYMREKLL